MNNKAEDKIKVNEKDIPLTGSSNIKISIVLYATLKGYKYIERTIDSVLSQEYQNFELIVVSDASEGKTLKVIESFKDQRIQLIHFKRIVGLGKALNAGFDRATGEYFTWISDICFYERNAFKDFIQYLNTHTKVDFVYGNHFLESPEDQSRKEIQAAHYLDFVEESPLSPGFFYSQSLAKTIGKYQASYEMAADYDYWIKLLREYAMVHWEHAFITIVDVPYYGEKLSRTRAYLFKRIIRYQNGFIKISQLERGVWDFQDRIKRLSANGFEQFVLTIKIIPKLFNVSFRMGFTVSGLLIYSAYSDHLEPLLKGLLGMFQKIKLCFLSVGLKKFTKSKNVLCVIPEVVVGGSEKVVKDIIEATSSANYKYHLLAIAGENNDWVSSFLKEFQNVVLFDKSFNNYNTALDDQYYLYLSFLVEKLKIDVLLISNPHAAYRCLPRLKKNFSNLKVMDLIHVEKFCASMEETFDAIPYIDRRICISHRLKDHMIKKYENSNIDKQYVENLKVIHNGNDMNNFKNEKSLENVFKDKYKIKHDTKIVSYVGRLSSEKRPIVFVDAAREIIEKCPGIKIKFVMAGDGLYMKAVEGRIQQHGIGDYFVLTGMVNALEVKQLLTDSFALLITSSIEGLPLVAVEAMSMGVPVISTNVGAINEAIDDGVNGYLVDSQDQVVLNLARKVTDLLSSDDLYRSVQSKTRSAVEQEFSLGVFAEKYLIELNSLCEKSK